MEAFKSVIELRGRRFLFAVETSKKAADYAKYEKLREQIWGDPDDHFSGFRNMACENFIHEGASLFLGVFREESEGRFDLSAKGLVAFAYGYVGVKDKEIAFKDHENLVFYSQYAAVHEDFQKYNLGVQLKLFQKKVVLDVLGVRTITCTYDPLTGVNAYRNIHVLGMEVMEYREACYESFTGKLNRPDVPCDRFFVSWDLEKTKQKPGCDLKRLIDFRHVVLGSSIKEIEGKTGLISLEIVQEESCSFSEEFLLVEVPYDFYAMLRETDVRDKVIRQIPVDWRMKSRKAFVQLFRSGYKAVDFQYIQEKGRIRDFYVFKKPEYR